MKIVINIKELIGITAVSYKQADLLFSVINKHIEVECVEEIELNFDEVDTIASPFFIGSIGVLLKKYNIKEIQKKFKIKGLSENSRDLLNFVIDNAIKHYKKP